MNIMIINHYAGSDQYGMEFRPLYIGRELVKLGHTVTVIAADYSHLRKKNPIIEKSFTEELIDEVRYVFVKTPVYKKNDAKRFLNMISFLRQISKNSRMLCEKYKPDAIVASSTYPYDVKAAKKIAAHGTDVKVFYEIHDIWPLSLIELYSISPKNPYMQSLQKAEHYAYTTVDGVISILPDADRHIKELGYNNINYKYVPNGIITDEKKHKPAPEAIANIISKLHSEGKFVLMYLGGFSKANALEYLLDASPLLNENIHIVMVGDGPLRAEFESVISQNGYTNVTLTGAVEKTQVNSTLSLADALYIGAKRCSLYRFGVGMNKLFDYMLSKRPVLYGVEASNNPVGDAGCGLYVEPESPQAIAEACDKLMSLKKAELDQMGMRGYDYVVENHNYQKLAKQFLQCLQQFRKPE